MSKRAVRSMCLEPNQADDGCVEEDRFIVVAGDVIDLANDPRLDIIDRLDVVLLARTTPERSSELSSRADLVVSVYATEALARIAFDLFRR
jgi:hypothetical protein